MPMVLLLSGVASAALPIGTTLDPAITVDVSAEGLSSLELLVADFLPPSIPLPEIHEADFEETCIDLIFDEFCWNWYEYQLDVYGLDASVQLTTLDIRPSDGFLEVDVVLTANVATPSAPGTVYAFLEVIDVISLTEDCDVWLDPTPIAASTTMLVELVQDPGLPPRIDVSLRPMSIDLDISGLRVQNCTIGDILDFVDAVNDFTSSFLSFDLYDFVAGAAEPLVEGLVNDLLPAIEEPLNEALANVAISETFDLGGSSLIVDIAPSALEITPAGMHIDIAGSIAPAARIPHPCVRKYRPDGSLDTPGAPWGLGDWPPGDAGLLQLQVDDDLINQALWSVWYGGLLCIEVSDDSGLDLPIPIDTSLLGLLAGDAYDDLFPVAGPLVIATRPTLPPTARLDGIHDIELVLDGFGLDMLAELDGRLTRVAGLELIADAGADLNFDGTTGMLAAELDIGAEAIQLDVVFNDLRPETSADIEDGLRGLVETLVPSLIGGLVSDLAFPLPSIEGLGLSALIISASGEQGDQLGIVADVGPVPYDNAADAEGGCGGGCDAGCNSRGGGAAWLLALAGLIGLRRRR